MAPRADKLAADDAEKASIHNATEQEQLAFDAAVVKTLKRKADFILLPILTFAYLLK